MSKNLIVKDNALINASYNLDLTEQRLILLAITYFRKKGNNEPLNEQTKLEISVKDFINAYNLKGHSIYENLKFACKSLFERQFSYIEKSKQGQWVITSRWVSEIAYLDELAKVRIRFAPAVVPLIAMLEKHFTSYELEQVADLNSKYAVRLLKLLLRGVLLAKPIKSA